MTTRDVKKIVTDIEMDKEFERTSFGDANRRHLIKWSLMKRVSGWHDGGTITFICQNLKLLGKTHKLTQKGRRYLWAAFYEHYNEAKF